MSDLDTMRGEFGMLGRTTLHSFIYHHFFQEVSNASDGMIDRDGVCRIMKQFEAKLNAMNLEQLVDVAIEVIAIQGQGELLMHQTGGDNGNREAA